MKRTAWVFVALAVVIAGGYIGFRALKANAQSKNSAPQTALASVGNLQATVASSGNIEPAQSLDLSFGSGGTVTSVLVKPGDPVKAGDPLAKLDDSALAAQVANAQASLATAQARLDQLKQPASDADIATARASLESAQAAYDAAKAKAATIPDQLAVAEAALAKARQNLQDAQAAYDRVSWRPDIGRLPQSAALQQATNDYQTAQANYNIQIASIQDTNVKSAAVQLAQAQAALDKLLAGPASTDVTIAQAAVDQAKISLDTARQNLAKATLTAPFDGTVTQVNVIPGQTVAGGTVVVSVADLGRLRVKANVAEIDVPRIKVGQPVNVSVDAIPDAQLTGKVSDVALVGTVSQGVVNYAVTVDLDPTDSRVKAGMSASLVIVVDERSNVLMVPNRAIHTLTGGRGYYVDVMVEGQIVQVQVNIGLANDSMTEITGGGLREGDAVVISTSRTTTSGGGTFGGLFRGMGGGGVPVINQRTGD